MAMEVGDESQRAIAEACPKGGDVARLDGEVDLEIRYMTVVVVVLGGSVLASLIMRRQSNLCGKVNVTRI